MDGMTQYSTQTTHLLALMKKGHDALARQGGGTLPCHEVSRLDEVVFKQPCCLSTSSCTMPAGIGLENREVSEPSRLRTGYFPTRCSVACGTRMAIAMIEKSSPLILKEPLRKGVPQLSFSSVNESRDNSGRIGVAEALKYFTIRRKG